MVRVLRQDNVGPTTLAHCQAGGGTAAFIDAEHALDPSWAKRLGVNLADLLVSQPDTGEQALEICEMLVRSMRLNIVVDSEATLIPSGSRRRDRDCRPSARLAGQALRHWCDCR